MARAKHCSGAEITRLNIRSVPEHLFQLSYRRVEMEIEFKTFQVKADETGALEAVFSTFGVIDDDGDIVEASAFTNGQPVAMVWSHDWADPVGKGTVEVTAKEAIFRGSFFMETTRGLEAFKTVKAMGDLQE